MSTKILAFTGIRSDYDLMSGLYKLINQDPNMELKLIVSGAHLAESYGFTVQYIEKDNLSILARIESLIDSNSKQSRLKSASILLQNCIDVIAQYKPDVMLFPGDREDVITAALVGAYLGIPTVHFFGGDHASDGNVDNPVRHATSKLSSVHFVTHESHKKRLLKIGEPENRVFVIGNPALDRFVETKWIEKKDLLFALGRPGWDEYALMIHHPILGFEDKAGEYFEEILVSLKERNIPAFVSYPNSDPGNRSIISVINKYKEDPSFHFYKNLDRDIFINLMRNASFMIGNSSAGLLEAPIIPLSVINVGERQKDRLAAGNVVFVDQGLKNIRNGINTVLSPEFQANLKTITSPYGNGDSSIKAYNLLKKLNVKEYQFKREDPIL